MKYLKYIFMIGLFLICSSCGYQLESGGYINTDVTRISVKAFENKSAETGAGIAFTNALIREILQKTDTKVVDQSQATAVFEGTIKAITFASLSRSTTESVIERRITASVDVRLVNSDGETVWSVKDFVTHEDYTVAQDKIKDESNKSAAVEKIALRTAEKLVSKMLINF